MLLSSLLFGSAILVRPIGQFAVVAPSMIPLAFAGVPWRKRIGLVALVVSIPAIVVAGWSLRNYRLSGVASLSTIGAINFFYYRAGGTLAYASHVEWEEELQKLTPPDRRASLTKQAIKIIAHHPEAFAEMTTWSFLYLCFVPDRTPLSHLLGVQQSFPLDEPGSMRAREALDALYISPSKALRSIYRSEFYSSATLLGLTIFQILWLLALWIGVIVGLRFIEHRSYEGLCAMFCTATAFGLILLASGPEAVARFRIPAVPFLAVLGGIGWSRLRMHGFNRSVVCSRGSDSTTL